MALALGNFDWDGMLLNAKEVLGAELEVLDAEAFW